MQGVLRCNRRGGGSGMKMKQSDYEAIRKSVEKWPKWKKDLCNRELIASKNAKKI